MRMDNRIECSTEDIVRLIDEYPLATVVSCDGQAFQATPLPLLADVTSNGDLVSLTGHIARSNPQVEMLRRAGHAFVIFQGPNAYVSPSWMRDRKHAPTWHYVAAHFEVNIELLHDPCATHDALSRMVQSMELGSDNAWHLSELAERFDSLFPAIVGFKASILNARMMFKLGVDERVDVYHDIINGLRQRKQDALVDWMTLQARDSGERSNSAG